MGSEFETRFSRLYEYIETIRELFAGKENDQLTHIPPPSPRLAERTRAARPPQEGRFGKHWGSLVGGPRLVLGAYHSEISIKRAAVDFDGWLCSPGRTNYNTMRDAINCFRDNGGRRAMISSCHVDLTATRKITDDDSFYLQCSRDEAVERLGRLTELGFDDIFFVASNSTRPRPLYEQDFTIDQLAEWRALLPRDLTPIPGTDAAASA
jgi:alkanesulfonate monooxygenase SsuD/methylene tetrahydromethanopterin reductase-like flavin-dependent oxidoreductase (luciferase family)